MTRLSLLLFVFMIFSASDCEKEDEVPMPEPETPERIRFEGVSLTDANGNALSQEDTTDWRVDDEWEAEEMALFEEGASLPLCSADGETKVFAVWPNPASRQFAFGFRITNPISADFRLVDQDFNLLLSHDTLQFTNPGFNQLEFDATSLAIRDTVRMYYQFSTSNCVFRGHGDLILVE